jgi:hypothetical protein
MALVASGTVSLSESGIIDVRKAVQQDIADVGGELPASVNFAIRKKGDEIESGAATVSSASAKGPNTLAVANEFSAPLALPEILSVDYLPILPFPQHG